jgi:hypothetical protein
VQKGPQTTLERALLLVRLLVPDRLLSWRLTTNQLVWIIRGLIIVGFLLAIGYPYDKGLWDWLELLIVPAVIAVGVFLLDQRQRERDRAAEEDRQRRQQQEMEEQRDRELQVEDQRAQDAALQIFLDKMDDMMDRLRIRDKPTSFSVVRGGMTPNEAERQDELRTLMRARTLTVLERLDGSRKRAVMRFLVEVGLLDGDSPAISLSDANLERADLSRMDLRNKNLKGTRLNHANLRSVYLEGTDLRSTNLSAADLSGAQLGTARRFRVPSEEQGFDELAPSPPQPTNLTDADLGQANLQWARGWTHEQLDKAEFLEGATMPDGMQYEVWVKRGWLRQRSGKRRW